VNQQNYFAVWFKGFSAPKVSSATNRTPYTKSFPLFSVVFSEFDFAGFSARSPTNLTVFALALSAARCWLTAYSSSHLVTLVLLRFCVLEGWLTSEPALSSSFSYIVVHGTGSSSSPIWMLHASAPWFEWYSTWQIQRCASNPSQPPLLAYSDDARDPWVRSGFSLPLTKWKKSICRQIFDQFDKIFDTEFPKFD